MCCFSRAVLIERLPFVAQFSVQRQCTGLPGWCAPFDNYLNEVERYLLEHRAFISDDKAQEMSMNMPLNAAHNTQYWHLVSSWIRRFTLLFVMLPTPCVVKAFTLEPSCCRDTAKPGDMLNVSYQQWQTETNHHIRLFSEEVDNLYIGGFSTGANLTTIASFSMAEELDIKGLMHFSPAFKSRFFVSR